MPPGVTRTVHVPVVTCSRERPISHARQARRSGLLSPRGQVQAVAWLRDITPAGHERKPQRVRLSSPLSVDDAGASDDQTAVGPLHGSSATSTAASTGRVRRVVGPYVALTKPRVIELLLVTTVPDDDPGGRRMAGARARPRDARRRCRGGRVGQRAELLPRPRHRQDHEPHQAAAAGHRRGQPARGAGLRARARRVLAGVAVARRQPRVGLADRGGDPHLRRRLHDDPQAPHAAEHRLGRRRRLHARAHRLVGGHRGTVLDRGAAVRRDLLLDAAALLAAVDEVQAGLRRRGRPDAPGRRQGHQGRAGDDPATPWR